VARVFISYSSDDEAFAHGLHAALKSRHQVWLDSREIAAGTDFRASIDPALEACECVVVVRTPAWLASTVCRYEAARAAEWRKRLVPVEPKRLPRGLVWPPELNGLSPIGFWREAGRSAALRKLRHDLEADHHWLARHAELLVDALRWQRSDGHDLRLRGTSLREAVQMVERAAAGAVMPDLLPVQRDYVRACEAAEAAEVERLTLLNRRAVSRQLAAEAQRVWIEHPANIGLALRLAAESLRRAPGTVARDLAARLVKLAPRAVASLPGTAGARRLHWAPGGLWLAVAMGDRVLALNYLAPEDGLVEWPLTEGLRDMRFDHNDLVVLNGQGQAWRLPLRGGAARVVAQVQAATDHAALSADGRRAAWARDRTLWVGSTVDRELRPPSRVDRPRGVKQFEIPYRVREIALAPASAQVAVFADATVHLAGAKAKQLLRLIDTNAGTWIDLDQAFRMNLTFSDDGQWLAAQTHLHFDVWRVADGAHVLKQDGSFETWMGDEPELLFSRAVMRRSDEEHAPRERRLLRRRIDIDTQPSQLAVQPLDARFTPLLVHQREALAGTCGSAARVVDLRLGTTTAIVEQRSVPRLAVAHRCGLLATVSDVDEVRIFDLEARNERRWGPYIAGISSVAASTDGRWLARGLEHAGGSMLGALPVDGDPLGSWDAEGHIGPVAVSVNGRVAAVLEPLTMWSGAGTRQLGQDALAVGDAAGLRTWPRDKPSQAVAISPDGRHVVELLHDGRVAWLRPDSPEADPFLLDVQGAELIALDTSGRWLMAAGSGSCAVLDLDRGAACALRREGVACAAFAGESKAGTGLWVAEVQGGLRRLALPSGRSTRHLAWPETPGFIGAGDGPRTLWLVQGTSLFWIDAGRGTVLQRVELGGEVLKVLPSPSRHHFWVTTKSECSVWRMPEGDRCLRLDEHNPTVAWLAGDRLAVRDGATFRIESPSLDTLLADAAARVGATLREHEWRMYLPDEPWPGDTPAQVPSGSGSGSKPR
jgi:hypothetical protein